MTTYGWTNSDGEPIMDGAAYRFEQQLDAEYAEQREFDSYDDYADEADYDECDACGGDIDPKDSRCFDCGRRAYFPDAEASEVEDAWLDSYMEDRLTTMFE